MQNSERRLPPAHIAAIAWIAVAVLCGMPACAQERLRMATTTAVQDSGLMEYLVNLVGSLAGRVVYLDRGKIHGALR